MDPRSPANRSKCVSKWKSDLVTKINETLEPLLGAQQVPRRRIGGLRSHQRRAAGGNPRSHALRDGQFAENGGRNRARQCDLFRHPRHRFESAASSRRPEKDRAALSRRTENVTYQTSRVIRNTKIPQGVVRRMSLAVLVDQAVHWEGKGSAGNACLCRPRRKR